MLVTTLLNMNVANCGIKVQKSSYDFLHDFLSPLRYVALLFCCCCVVAVVNRLFFIYIPLLKMTFGDS